MRTSGLFTKLSAAVALCGAGLLVAAWAWPARAQDKTPDGLAAESPHAADWKDFQYQEAANCSFCHAGPNAAFKGAKALDLVLMAEYAIWKTHDKHAQAYAVLEGKRGQQMGKLLGVDVTKPEAGCLNCHAMANLKRGDVAVDKLDGVSCGGCHGPSTGWVGPHAQAVLWRKKTADEKFKLGLRDLRDPVVRAELCMSCHVGNAAEGKVVTHAMFAAGHPPLPPVEIASFSRNEPQHWRDAKDVPYFQKEFPAKDDPAKLSEEAKAKNYHLEDLPFLRTKQALVGSAVALRETMKLVAARADAEAKMPKVLWPELLLGDKAGALPDDAKLKAEFKDRWPEIAMATSDCFACHHDLKYPGFRQARGFGYTLSGRVHIPVKPGRPVVRMWPTALLQSAAAYAGNGKRLEDLEARLRTLAQACDARPFGDPAQVRTAATDLVKWSDDLIAKLIADPYTRDSVLKLMHNLTSLYDVPNAKAGSRTLVPDYEAAREVASILAVAYDDWRGKEPADPKAAALLAAMSEELNLQPYIRRQQRGQVILDVVRRITMSNDVKASEEFSAFVSSLGEGKVMPADVDKLLNNAFLNTIRNGVDNRKFTDELVKNQEVIDKLQKYSDEEEANTLRRVAEYDPAKFLAQLRAFAKLLPAQPGKQAAANPNLIGN
jgi:hypothetical protein